MHPGIYIGLSGSIVQEEKLNVITTNLAFANVPGYKKDAITFQQYFLSTMEKVKTDLSAGNIHNTGNSFDFAIQGEGYFTVKTPMGIGFTRRGDFSLDAKRRLVTKEGFLVLGKRGPIVVKGSKLEITSDAQVVVDGKVVDKLRIATFPTNNLLRLGTSLLVPPSGVSPSYRFSGEIWQGYLEESNVNVVKEMVNMVDVLRTYETCQKIVQTIDETTGKAVNEVGSVRT
ncbi:MAG: flagellar hook-basal body protein [Candidatus Desulfofervidaceae bacterium]|nr:flagellar hook-basal body protein [Candidatus Desulfofervidaceae bacterium]MDL1969702.1 flagellar hook-basal body protein [Candidatus Desulfofervidaceae bacterium]